jgi:hypothetical protein
MGTEKCKDCDEAAKHAYSDATTPGFFSPKCARHASAEPAPAPTYSDLLHEVEVLRQIVKVNEYAGQPTAAPDAYMKDQENFEKVALRYPLSLDKDSKGKYLDNRAFIGFQMFREGLENERHLKSASAAPEGREQFKHTGAHSFSSSCPGCAYSAGQASRDDELQAVWNSLVKGGVGYVANMRRELASAAERIKELEREKASQSDKNYCPDCDMFNDPLDPPIHKHFCPRVDKLASAAERERRLVGALEDALEDVEWLDNNAAGDDEPVWDKLTGMKARLRSALTEVGT